MAIPWSNSQASVAAGRLRLGHRQVGVAQQLVQAPVAVRRARCRRCPGPARSGRSARRACGRRRARRSAVRPAVHSPASGSSTANSSPPSRTTVSSVRTHSRSRVSRPRAAGRPRAAWPIGSLTSLKRSRPSSSSDASASCRPELGAAVAQKAAVAQPGDLVVQRESLELLALSLELFAGRGQLGRAQRSSSARLPRSRRCARRPRPRRRPAQPTRLAASASHPLMAGHRAARRVASPDYASTRAVS